MDEQAVFDRMREVIEFAYPGAQTSRIEVPEGDDVNIKVTMPCVYNSATDEHLHHLSAEVEIDTGVTVLLIPCYQGENP